MIRQIFHHARSRGRALAENIRASRQDTSNLDLVVVSYGGGGTTSIADYLGKRFRTNSWDSNNDGIKHACSSNHPVFEDKTIGRALYIYSNPVQAIISLFRRDFQNHMIPKLTSANHRNALEYRNYVKDNGVTITLEEYARNGIDQLGIKAHFQNWLNEPTHFPVALVRFETLYDNLNEFFDVMEFDTETRAAFPPKRARATSLSAMDQVELAALEDIYRDMIAHMDQLPPILLRPVSGG